MNPVRSEVAGIAPETLVSFVPMDAVGEQGGLNVSQERYIEDVYSGYTYFAEQDILVAKITPCFENNKGALATGLKNGIGFGTTEFHVLRPTANVSPKWLFYLTMTHSFREVGGANMLGAGGQKRVPEDYIKNYRTAIPPFNEQQQIANFLDWKTAQIDALIAKKKELIGKLQESRLAVISETIIKGTNPNVTLTGTNTPWLKQIPSHWETIPLGFLTTMSGGSTPSMANATYWEGDIPWVSPKDMKQPRITDSTDHVTAEALAETSLSLIPVNTVLIVVRGMILAHSFPTAITEVPVTINQDMKALRCTEQLNVEYLFWCLTGFAKVFSNLAQESAHGTRKMETETIKKFVMPVPPIEEQISITSALEERLQKLDELALATSKTINYLAEYRVALITAATAGKIDVRNVRIPESVA